MPRKAPPDRRAPPARPKKPPTAGSFRPGADPRRHKFSKTEARRGYQAAWDTCAAMGAEALAWFTRKVRTVYRREKKHGPKED